jgi:hypothetical protein
MAAGVYILQSGESGEEILVKIGRAADIEARRRSLSTGNPHPLRLYDVIETQHASTCEAFLQNRLQSRRSRRSDAQEFYEVEPSILDLEIHNARDFVDFLPTRERVKGLAKEWSDGRVVLPRRAELDAHRRLLEIREEKAALEFEEEQLEAILQTRIGTASSLDGIATWKTGLVARFDCGSFRLAHPAVYGEFLRKVPRRVFRLL